MNEQHTTAHPLADAIVANLERSIAVPACATAVAQAQEQPQEPAPKDPNYIELDTPLKRGEQTITGITLRKPQAGELRGIQLANLMMLDIDSLKLVLPRITSPTLTPQDVNVLDLPDIMALGMKVLGFFAPKADPASPLA